MSGEGEVAVDDGMFLSLDLRSDDDGLVGYRARRNSELLDLSQRGLDPDLFWEPVSPEKGSTRLVLEPEEFYLLISRESVAIPPDLAAEMNAYDPTSGELRTHYAGFFDPGFGYGDGSRSRRESGARGACARCPVRRRARTTHLHARVRTHARIRRRSCTASVIGSTYQAQTSFLSKYFTAALSSAVASGASTSVFDLRRRAAVHRTEQAGSRRP